MSCGGVLLVLLSNGVWYSKDSMLVANDQSWKMDGLLSRPVLPAASKAGAGDSASEV
jgi:hypothetical protein